MRAERLTSAVAHHGEGPVWSERWGGPRWVDMLAGNVLSLGADGSISSRHVGSVEGGVWVALVGGSEVHRYTPRGQLVAVIELPVTKVTACTFGGPRLDRLFITTSREGLSPGDEPAAGSLSVADVGVRGIPAREFAG